MPISPCLSCALKDGDKNNRRCRNCRQRLTYLQRLTRQLEFSACYTAAHEHALHLPRP
jgi:hypothetical protein